LVDWHDEFKSEPVVEAIQISSAQFVVFFKKFVVLNTRSFPFNIKRCGASCKLAPAKIDTLTN